MKSKNLLLVIGVVVIVGGVVSYISWQSAKTPGRLDGFAQCLKDRGAVFYGAFWCPHCQSQKALFGKSKKFLPYVECSTADGQGQLPVCQDKNISGYPTWEFTDGSRESGEVSLEKLAEKTGCALPGLAE
ncbi:MAG: thioredoxin domain-containing protein [Patescibacteria group bacterium]